MPDAARILANLRSFARPVNDKLVAVDEALPALRGLFAAAAVPYKIVGGVAVVHHGYARSTLDIDVLVSRAALARVDSLLAGHGFVRERDDLLRHSPTGVPVDLLFAGEPMPGKSASYPEPSALAPSDEDPSIVGLAGLVVLKLRAARHRDSADIVEVLKVVDDGRYLSLEASLPAELRPEFARLRRDALEELRWATSLPKP